MIDQAGAPSVLFGVPPDGNASGYLLNQLINTARVSFQQIARHAEQALERIVQLMWRLVETRIGETVFVFEAEDDHGWIGLGPQDIDGYHAVRVRLDPLGPADDVAQGTLAASLVGARLASRRWAMREKLGIEDAETVEDEILLDELIDAPEIRTAIAREALGPGRTTAHAQQRKPPMPTPESPETPEETLAQGAPRLEGAAALHPLQGERQIRPSAAEIGEGSSGQPSLRGHARVSRVHPTSAYAGSSTSWPAASRTAGWPAPQPFRPFRLRLPGPAQPLAFRNRPRREPHPPVPPTRRNPRRPPCCVGSSPTAPRRRDIERYAHDPP